MIMSFFSVKLTNVILLSLLLLECSLWSLLFWSFNAFLALSGCNVEVPDLGLRLVREVKT